ncbi:stalk domain-containing protein [Rummeliibacillus sp. NPDC094406]|uniref:stalk domain-containing protein n=1 Tax=Rummeliibacillus sp. NPDC094406 TaxID=3364511 RepID=UPI0037F47A26
MKHQISSLLIASTVLATTAFTPIALNEVSAKTVQQQKVEKGSIIVDGKAKSISFSKSNKQKLYSAEQFSKLITAKYKYNSKTKTYELSKQVNKKQVKVSYKANVKTAVINGKKTKVNVAPKLIGKKLYIEAGALVKAFGGDFDGNFLSTTGLVSGDAFEPQWVNNSTILVSNEDIQDSRTLLLNTTTKKVVHTVNGTGLVVSPNGKQAIYSDENGFVYLVDLMSKQTKKLNAEDDSVKTEFVWSHDCEKVYFIQGDKSEKIGSINISDGAVTTIFADSLNYKADLHLSVDGNKLLYTVGKEGSTSFTDGDDPEVENIDTTGTEPQIYALNLTEATPAAVAVTTTTDNKVFPGFVSNGNIVYLSTDPEDDQLPKLKMIDENNKITTLSSTKDIVYSLVTPKGELMILVAESNGSSTIYKVNTATKKLTKLVSTKLKLSSFSASNDKLIAGTTSDKNGEKVVVLKKGSFDFLTK